MNDILTGYEEFLFERNTDGTKGRLLGTRFAGTKSWKPDRLIGEKGMKRHAIFKDTVLMLDGRRVSVKASEQKPFYAISTLEAVSMPQPVRGNAWKPRWRKL
jgi:hypothetical protein